MPPLPALTVISLGGVQSSVMALMAGEGAFDRLPDCVIFADTRWEAPSSHSGSRNHADMPVHVLNINVQVACVQRYTIYVLHSKLLIRPLSAKVTDIITAIESVPPEGSRMRRYEQSEFLANLTSGQLPYYVTELGEAWVGDSRQLLKKLPSASIDLVVTSPPYSLVKKKEYGNESQQDYVRWFRPFAKEIYRVLKKTGSLVLNVAGAWEKGQPTRSMYPYRLILDLCEPHPRRKSPPVFHLAQEFYWLNPAKLPNPVQWTNITRERAKDAVEPVWWLSKSPHPKANNRNVLVPYSDHMQRLLKTGKYNRGPRPSGWNISNVWAKDNGGAIPSNFESDDALNYLLNVIVISNTSSNDTLRTAIRDAGQKAHPAMFPTALPEFFIRMLTDQDDKVLDPFSGSNATGSAAERLRRRWLSIDINGDYVETSRFRWSPPPSLTTCHTVRMPAISTGAPSTLRKNKET